MDKQAVIKEMKAYVNGCSYITVSQLARHVGRSKQWAYKMVAGLDKLPGETRGTKYFIVDVAGRLMDAKRQ